MPERSLNVEQDLQTLLELCAGAACHLCHGDGLITGLGVIERTPVLSGQMYWHLYANGDKARVCKSSVMRKDAAAFLGGTRS
jgi:hypothetical protein